MTRASFDKARVADKWSEALVAIGSTDGPYSEGGDPQQSAEDLVEQATRILASIALADSSTSGSDARWLRDAGIGAVELINCGTEIILRERLRVSAEGGQSDIYLNAAPDDDEPWQRALSVLSERAEILEIAAMDYTPEMGEIDPDVLGTRMNVFAFPSHSEQSEDEEEIRTSFFSVPDLEDSPIDSWADVLAVWRAHAIDHLPQLIGSKGSQTLWWLSGIGVLALFAQGKAASFEAGFDELTIGVGDLSLEAPDSPIDVGKPESDQLDLGGLESLPGAGALLSSIERIHNFDSTGKARREKKLLRREIPLSVVITSETNQALDPRTGAMAYATALEHLEIAPAPQELDRDAATEFFRAVAGGVSQDGSFVINFEDFTFPPKPSFSYAFCSDTIYAESIVPHIKEVTVLYHEATFTDKDAERAKSTFHSTATQAAQIATLAGVKKLYLGHLSARYENSEIHRKEAQLIFDAVEVVEDGVKISVSH